MQEKFSYSAQPHAAPVNRPNRPKYRDDIDQDGNSAPRNLMYDSRVIRGNTYASNATYNVNKENINQPNWKKSMRRDASKRKFIGDRVSTPPPVGGRVHMDIQTDDFLEELTDRPIQMDMETQTLPFSDRPPSPLFVKAKTGLDIETQILPGDLFNFDLEVEPILEVLVGKTLHVAMLEALQEEELEAIRLQQEEYEAIRNVEIAEVQRLEAELRRKTQEKERRIAQEKQRVEDKRLLEEKIAARSFAHEYLGSLHEEVFALLEEEGVFYDPVEKEVEEIFLRDIYSSLSTKVDVYSAARFLADELLESVRVKSKVFELDALEKRKQYKEQLAKEEALREEARINKLNAEKLAAQLAAEAEEADDDME